jgi:hypothetical protein
MSSFEAQIDRDLFAAFAAGSPLVESVTLKHGEAETEMNAIVARNVPVRDESGAVTGYVSEVSLLLLDGPVPERLATKIAMKTEPGNTVVDRTVKEVVSRNGPVWTVRV